MPYEVYPEVYPEYEEEPWAVVPPSRISIPKFLPPVAVLLMSVIFFYFFVHLIGASDFYPNDAFASEKDPSLAAPLQPAASSNQAVTAGGIAPLFTAQVQHWAPQIVAWSQKWGLDPNLVATIMQIESCGDPSAQSSSGAMGLFQVMPFHFVANEDGFDPATNAKRGLAYLSQALSQLNGDDRLAMAGYNAGIGGASGPESSWPAETMRYVYWGTGIYADAHQGKAQSSRLDEWLNAGGSGLCTRAGQNLGLP